MDTVLNGLAVRLLVLQLYDNGKVLVTDTNPKNGTTWVVSRLATAVVAPGDEVFAISMKGRPVIVGRVATSSADTATVTVNWDQINNPPPLFTPDVREFIIDPQALATTTKTASFQQIVATSIVLPAGRWACVLDASAYMWRSVATGSSILRLQIGGALFADETVTNQTGLASTAPLTVTTKAARSDRRSNAIVYASDGNAIAVSLHFRGNGAAGTTYAYGAKASGIFFRLPPT